MSVIKKYSETSLVLRIVIGLIIGLVLALVFPKAQWISMFGTGLQRQTEHLMELRKNSRDLPSSGTATTSP